MTTGTSHNVTGDLFPKPGAWAEFARRATR